MQQNMESWTFIDPNYTRLQMSGHDAQWVRAFGMNPKVGGSIPLRSRHFLSQKLWHFHKSIRSCVENECCSPRTVNSSNVNFT